MAMGTQAEAVCRSPALAGRPRRPRRWNVQEPSPLPSCFASSRAASARPTPAPAIQPHEARRPGRENRSGTAPPGTDRVIRRVPAAGVPAAGTHRRRCNSSGSGRTRRPPSRDGVGGTQMPAQRGGEVNQRGVADRMVCRSLMALKPSRSIIAQQADIAIGPLPDHRSQARRNPRRFRSGARSSWWSRCCAVPAPAPDLRCAA